MLVVARLSVRTVGNVRCLDNSDTALPCLVVNEPHVLTVRVPRTMLNVAN